MAQPSVLAMTTLLTRYSAGIPSHQPGDNPVKPRLSVILIIGTRGGLGTNLLVHLLLHKDVTKVYALNRAHLDGITVFNRQANEFKAHGLPDFGSPGVVVEARSPGGRPFQKLSRTRNTQVSRGML